MIWSVNNNCINNQKLKHLSSLSLLQWTEMWIVPDDNSVRKQGVEDWTQFQEIITVSKISN